MLLLLYLSEMAQKKLPKYGWIQLFNSKDIKCSDIKIKGHPLNENFGNTFRVRGQKALRGLTWDYAGLIFIAIFC